jgi:glycolate oxidase iron-sulfur subunit
MDDIKKIALLQTPDYQRKLAQCIHCGLCLQACPTYAVFGSEMDAPRGRIALIRAASQGRVGLEDFKDVFTRHINLCLACRACETACPSGVQYGSLVEMARLVIEENRRPGFAERALRWVGMQQLMPNLYLLKFLARLLWAYEKSGLQRLVRRLAFLPGPLQAMEAILPPLEFQFTRLGELYPALGERQGKVMFFTGCIQEAFLSAVNQATIRVLQRNGFDVFVPTGQSCCGAAHLHLGDLEKARALARCNIDAFRVADEDWAALICNAGGCGLALKEYPRLLADDAEYAADAAAFAAKLVDFSEFMCDHLLAAPEGQIRIRATYVDSCHLRHGQNVIRQPRQLLQMIPGLEYVELSQPERCCGSAGVYNIAQVGTADKILEAKMEDIAATGAELVVASNTGCHMQLLAGVRKAGLAARVAHIAEVLDWSYRNQQVKEE